MHTQEHTLTARNTSEVLGQREGPLAASRHQCNDWTTACDCTSVLADVVAYAARACPNVCDMVVMATFSMMSLFFVIA